jgi:hypothetical protein
MRNKEKAMVFAKLTSDDIAHEWVRLDNCLVHTASVKLTLVETHRPGMPDELRPLMEKQINSELIKHINSMGDEG